MITMNFSENILTTTNPVILLFHADSMLSRDQPPRAAEDLYREYLAKHLRPPRMGSDPITAYAKRKLSFFADARVIVTFTGVGVSGQMQTQ